MNNNASRLKALILSAGVSEQTLTDFAAETFRAGWNDGYEAGQEEGYGEALADYDLRPDE